MITFISGELKSFTLECHCNFPLNVFFLNFRMTYQSLLEIYQLKMLKIKVKSQKVIKIMQKPRHLVLFISINQGEVEAKVTGTSTRIEDLMKDIIRTLEDQGLTKIILGHIMLVELEMTDMIMKRGHCLDRVIGEVFLGEVTQNHQGIILDQKWNLTSRMMTKIKVQRKLTPIIKKKKDLKKRLFLKIEIQLNKTLLKDK